MECVTCIAEANAPADLIYEAPLGRLIINDLLWEICGDGEAVHPFIIGNIVLVCSY